MEKKMIKKFETFIKENFEVYPTYGEEQLKEILIYYKDILYGKHPEVVGLNKAINKYNDEEIDYLQAISKHFMENKHMFDEYKDDPYSSFHAIDKDIGRHFVIWNDYLVSGMDWENWTVGDSAERLCRDLETRLKDINSKYLADEMGKFDASRNEKLLNEEEEWIGGSTPYFKEKENSESGYAISKAHVHKIINRLGFTNYRYLKEGAMGFVYKVWDKTDQKIKVVKITTDIEEAHFANSFRNKNPKHLATYYDIREIYYNDEPTSTYSIVMDLINPLNKLQQRIWSALDFQHYYFENFDNNEKFIKNINSNRDIYDSSNIKNPFNDKEIHKYFASHAYGYSSTKRVNKKSIQEFKDFVISLIDQRQSVLKEFGKYGYNPKRDAHEENVGFKFDGTFVVFDPTFGGSRSKRMTLAPIKIYGKVWT